MSAVAAAAPLLTLQQRRRLARLLLLGAGGGAAAYAAYRVYNSEALAEARSAVARLRAALAAYGDALSSGAASLQLVLGDLHAYLAGDAHEVPPSLRQLARLMQSAEVADTTSATVAALLRGVSGGGAAGPSSSWREDGHAASAAAAPAKPALDRVLDALLSDRGHSLVSVAVSLGARNLVAGYCEARHRLGAADRAAAAQQQPPQPDLTNRLLDFLASPRGQQLAVLSVTAFVTSGMRAYLDQTLDLNFYEDLFAAMAKPEHLAAVKAVVGVFARDVVGAYLAGPSQQAQQQLEAPLAGPAAAPAPAQPQQQAAPALRRHEQLAPQEEVADTGSPCGSSVSGSWQRQAAAAAAAAPAGPGGSDVDSDVLLHPRSPAAAAAAKGAGNGGDSARSDDGGWAAAARGGAAAAAAQGAPVLPQLRRVQRQEAEGGMMQRSGSGNLEWISAVSKEWLAVAQHPQGRTVMVELAGTAAKEAARGVSSALADRFRAEWVLMMALAALLMAAVLQRLLAALLG